MLGPWGGDGVSRVVESWARGLTRHGARVTVVAESFADGGSAASWTRVACGDAGTALPLLRVFARARRAARRCADLHEAQPFDLLISHSAHLSIALRRQVPETPILATVHSPLVEEGHLNNWRYAATPRRLAYPLYRAIARRVEARALGAADAVHTLSAYTRTLLEARFPSATQAVRWERVPGSVDGDRFSPPADRDAVRERLGLDRGRPIVLTLRRLVPRNGVDRMIQCAESLGASRPEALFLIGGTGPLGPQPEPLADVAHRLAPQHLEPLPVAHVVDVDPVDRQQAAHVLGITHREAVPVDDRVAAQQQADLVHVLEAEPAQPAPGRARGLRDAPGQKHTQAVGVQTLGGSRTLVVDRRAHRSPRDPYQTRLSSGAGCTAGCRPTGRSSPAPRRGFRGGKTASDRVE